MIDWNRVNTLMDEVGTEDFDEVVDLFLDEVEGVIDRLDSPANTPMLGVDLHFLKGSALTLGFTDFSALCQKGEALAAKARVKEVDLTAIKASFAASKQVLLDGLPQALATHAQALALPEQDQALSDQTSL